MTVEPTEEERVGATVTPSPWKIGKGWSDRPYWIYRDVSPRPSFSHYEQLCDENGSLRTFTTEAQARAALAAALGEDGHG
jgi:hypothetical protein